MNNLYAEKIGEKTMRTFITAVILSLVIIFSAQLAVPEPTYACENTFEILSIAGVKYRIEYSCTDGSVVSVIILDE